jgi:hypothetical protein
MKSEQHLNFKAEGQEPTVTLAWATFFWVNLTGLTGNTKRKAVQTQLLGAVRLVYDELKYETVTNF